MGADPHGVLLGASLAFAGASVLGSVVAIRDQLPGEPLGVSIPLSVPAGPGPGCGLRRDRPGVHRRHCHRAGDPPAPIVVGRDRPGDRRQPGGVSYPDRSRCLACRHCAPSARRTLAVLLCACEYELADTGRVLRRVLPDGSTGGGGRLSTLQDQGRRPCVMCDQCGDQCRAGAARR